MSDKAIGVSQDPTDSQIAEIRLWAENDADIMQHDPRRDILFLLDALDTARLASEGETAQLRQRVEELTAENVALRDNNATVKAMFDDRAQQLAAAERLANVRLEMFQTEFAAKEASEATVASLSSALQQISRDDYGSSGGRIVKGNAELPGDTGAFYRGYNAGITGQFEKTRGIAGKALASIPAPAPRTEEQP